MYSLANNVYSTHQETRIRMLPVGVSQNGVRSLYKHCQKDCSTGVLQGCFGRGVEIRSLIGGFLVIEMNITQTHDLRLREPFLKKYPSEPTECLDWISYGLIYIFYMSYAPCRLGKWVKHEASMLQENVTNFKSRSPTYLLGQHCCGMLGLAAVCGLALRHASKI